MLAFTVLLVLSNVVSDAQAWAGFSSTSVLSIGALFVVARALEETRAIERILLPILGRPSGHTGALVRLCLPVMFFSAFLNNTVHAHADARASHMTGGRGCGGGEGEKGGESAREDKFKPTHTHTHTRTYT